MTDIVENREEALQKAHEISNNIMGVIADEIKKNMCDDDPAEEIYLGCHIAANIAAKTCIALKGYGQIYNIQNMEANVIHSWIKAISNELITMNENFLDDAIKEHK